MLKKTDRNKKYGLFVTDGTDELRVNSRSENIILFSQLFEATVPAAYYILFFKVLVLQKAYIIYKKQHLYNAL